jgi:hypothetical protein
VRRSAYTADGIVRVLYTINVSIVRIKTLLDLFAMAGPVIKSRSRRLQTRVRYIDSRRPAYTKYNIIWDYYTYMDASREHNITHTHTHT